MAAIGDILSSSAKVAISSYSWVRDAAGGVGQSLAEAIHTEQIGKDTADIKASFSARSLDVSGTVLDQLISPDESLRKYVFPVPSRINVQKVFDERIAQRLAAEHGSGYARRIGSAALDAAAAGALVAGTGGLGTLACAGSAAGMCSTAAGIGSYWRLASISTGALSVVGAPPSLKKDVTEIIDYLRANRPEVFTDETKPFFDRVKAIDEFTAESYRATLSQLISVVMSRQAGVPVAFSYTDQGIDLTKLRTIKDQAYTAQHLMLADGYARTTFTSGGEPRTAAEVISFVQQLTALRRGDKAFHEELSTASQRDLQSGVLHKALVECMRCLEKTSCVPAINAVDQALNTNVSLAELKILVREAITETDKYIAAEHDAIRGTSESTLRKIERNEPDMVEATIAYIHEILRRQSYLPTEEIDVLRGMCPEEGAGAASAIRARSVPQDETDAVASALHKKLRPTVLSHIAALRGFSVESIEPCDRGDSDRIASLEQELKALCEDKAGLSMALRKCVSRLSGTPYWESFQALEQSLNREIGNTSRLLNGKKLTGWELTQRSLSGAMTGASKGAAAAGASLSGGVAALGSFFAWGKSAAASSGPAAESKSPSPRSVSPGDDTLPSLLNRLLGLFASSDGGAAASGPVEETKEEEPSPMGFEEALRKIAGDKELQARIEAHTQLQPKFEVRLTPGADSSGRGLGAQLVRLINEVVTSGDFATSNPRVRTLTSQLHRVLAILQETEAKA